MNRASFPFVLIVTLLLGSCSSSVRYIQSAVSTRPIYSVSPERVLLVNTVDVAAQSYRDNKEELFVELIDTLLVKLSKDIYVRSSTPSNPLLGLTKADASERDNLILNLMSDHQCSDAIVITSFSVVFEQTGVDETKNEDGSKSREAYYDIVSKINYLWYDHDGIFKETEIERRRFHSSRSVISGLFAAGPNIVKRNDDAFGMVEDNLIIYLNHFFPGKELRRRPLFIGKEFANVNVAINAGNYEFAFTESHQLINHPDKKVAARAHYNCAVLLERSNSTPEIRQHLVKSQQLYPLHEAYEMMLDY